MISHVFISFSAVQIYMYDLSYVHLKLFFTIDGYITNSQCDQFPDGLIAQLVEHCSGIAEVMGSDPVQGQVVRKPVNTNPGLKVNRSIDFSCIKMFFASNFLFSWRLFKLKRERQAMQTENFSVNCKTEIKFVANPGLA